MSETENNLMASVQTLMGGLIDYAGLFPPSKLPMKKATEYYAKYLRAEHADFVGRFICPVPKLEELSKEAAIVMPGTFATSGYPEHADVLEPWQISGIIVGDLQENLEMIYRFNEHHDDEANGLALVDAIEMRVGSSEEIDEALEIIPEMIDAAFEVPQDIIMNGDPRGMIAAMSGSGVLAKIRCGGVEASMIPESRHIAEFMMACKNASVPFKCTAGLHHPVRSEHPLTYEDDAPRGMMHGFINVFFGAAYVNAVKKPDMDTLLGIIDETDPKAFAFDGQGITHRASRVTTIQLGQAREGFSTSYGSCSIDEPIADLKTMGLL
ncbi:MAG: hypothetical protein JJ974_08380 [Phycisphaerales bacterium]|nr:hypothetical protein [Phycisphaerales bacterium]